LKGNQLDENPKRQFLKISRIDDVSYITKLEHHAPSYMSKKSPCMQSKFASNKVLIVSLES